MTVLEGWLWEARRKAGAAAEARTWRLAFVVPRHLLPPFEDALAGRRHFPQAFSR